MPKHTQHALPCNIQASIHTCITIANKKRKSKPAISQLTNDDNVTNLLTTTLTFHWDYAKPALSQRPLGHKVETSLALNIHLIEV